MYKIGDIVIFRGEFATVVDSIEDIDTVYPVIVKYLKTDTIDFFTIDGKYFNDHPTQELITYNSTLLNILFGRINK